jgi:cytochrome P450
MLFGNIEPLEKNAYVMYARGAVERRMKKDPQQCDKDFISWLLEAKDPETGMGFELKELWAESSLLIAAGSDTSSTAMSALLFYLAQYPACLSKLSAELQTTFKGVEEIRSGAALTSCRYLRACIDEALRMAPPIPGLLLRTVMEGGMMIDGRYIPEGVNVGVSAYSIMHNPKYFPEPFIFKPERWLAEQGGEFSPADVELAKSAMCPFSIGSRGCIGKSMAYLELSIAMARLVYTYGFRAVDGDNDGAGKPGLEYGRHRKHEFQLVDNFICAKTGPLLEFESVTKSAPSQ